MKKRPCNSCPFLKETSNYGHIDWIEDVIAGIKNKSLTHTCHKTDPKADGYIGHKEGKESVCIGFTAMIKAFNNDCYDPRISKALIFGDFDWNDIETENVFQDPKEMLKHHLNQIINSEAMG